MLNAAGITATIAALLFQSGVAHAQDHGAPDTIEYTIPPMITTAPHGAFQRARDTAEHFSNFDRLCLSVSGRPVDAASQAAALSWTPGSNAARAALEGPRAINAQLWIPPVGNISRRLVTTESPPGLGQNRSNSCIVEAVHSGRLDAEQLRRLMQERTGLVPVTTDLGSIWLLLGDDTMSDGRSVVGRMDNLNGIVLTHPIVLVVVMGNSAGGEIVLVRMEPETRTAPD